MASASEPVPVEHLDFAFVNSCSDAKELARILKVLRSGSEGHYPELIAATEERLRQYNPKSLLLRYDQSAVRTTHLPDDERQNLLNDLDSWSKTMSSQETRIQEQAASSPAVTIPVRGQGQALHGVLNDECSPDDTLPSPSSSSASVRDATEPPASRKTERIKAYDYRSWDKFDGNGEGEDDAGGDDEREAAEKSETEATKEAATGDGDSSDLQRLADIAAKRQHSLSVVTEGKMDVELEQLARVEKEKGNESYRSGDHEEAIVFYTRSLMYQPTMASYNNRALVALKLRMHGLAEKDASEVLEHDSENAKALLRRAEARQFLWKFADAVADVKHVLRLQPTNKTAKDMLPYLEREARPATLRMESKESTTTQPGGGDASAAQPQGSPSANGSAGTTAERQQRKKHRKKKGTSIKITELGDANTSGGDSPMSSSPQHSTSPSSHPLSSSPARSSMASPGGKRKAKGKQQQAPKEPPKCTPKTARNIQPVGILKRGSPMSPATPGARSVSSSDSVGGGVDIPTPTGARRGLHWADDLVSTSPTSSYSGGVLSPTVHRQPFPSPPADGTGSPSTTAFAFGNGAAPQTATTADASAAGAADSVDGCVQAKMSAGGNKHSAASSSSSPHAAPQTVGQSTSAGNSAMSASAETATAAAAAAAGVDATATPAPVPVPLPAAVQKLKDEGNSLFKAGNYPGAMAVYGRALKQLGSDSDQASGRCTLLNNRAACHSKLGDCASCIGDCTQVLDVQSGNAKAWMRRGDAYRAQEKYGDAYADYQQVVVLDPSNCANAQTAMGRLLPHLKDQHGASWRTKLPQRPSVQPTLRPVAAAATLDSLSRSDGESSRVPARPAAAATSKATATTTKTTTAKAATEAKAAAPPGIDVADTKLKTTQTSTDLYETLKQRGNNFVKKSEWTEAVYCYNSCVACDAANPAAYSNRALCYLKLDKPELAEMDCVSALKLDPGNVKVLYRKALAQKAQHRYSDSLESLRAVVKLERGNTAALKEVQVVIKLAKEAGQIPDGFKKSSPPPPSSDPAQASSGADSSSAKPDTSPQHQSKSSKKKKKRKGGNGSGAGGHAGDGDGDGSEKGKERRPLIVKRVYYDSDEDVPEYKPTTASKPAASPATQPSGKNSSTPSATKAQPKDSKSSGTKATPKVQTAEDIEKLPPTVHQLSKGSPFEFQTAWSAVKQGDKLLQYYHILLQISPGKLPALIGNKCNGDMLMDILHVLSQHHVPSGDYEAAYQLLSTLPKLARFDMLAMFLSVGDKIEISRLLQDMSIVDWAGYCQDDLDKIGAAFGL